MTTGTSTTAQIPPNSSRNTLTASMARSRNGRGAKGGAAAVTTIVTARCYRVWAMFDPSSRAC
jgi:hypothetical protein